MDNTAVHLEWLTNKYLKFVTQLDLQITGGKNGIYVCKEVKSRKGHVLRSQHQLIPKLYSSLKNRT